MKILIINIDSAKIINLALKKIEIYYVNKGAEIYHDYPLMVNLVDKIFVSCIFTKNKESAEEYEMFSHAEIGGTGYDISKKLDPEIEKINPKINIDFSSRGCIRKCEFCFVPEKEGLIRAEKDLYDIWDGKNEKVTFLDNNILALPEHFKLICSQAQKENLWIDFNQGLDIRLLTDETAYIISQTKIKRIRFALDYNSLIPTFRKKLKILRKYIPNIYPFVYCLAGYGTTFEEDMERLLFLKYEKCRPYLMRHENIKGNKKYISMAQWSNQQFLFSKYTFEEFLKYKIEYELSRKKKKYNGCELPLYH